MRIIEMVYEEYKKAISDKEEKSISDVEFKITKNEINKILDIVEKTESKKFEVEKDIEVGILIIRFLINLLFYR